MFHLFSLVEEKVAALKSDIASALHSLHGSVSNAISFTADEVKDAEKAFMAQVDASEVNISRIFEAGANWAASRVTVAISSPPPDQPVPVDESAAQTPATSPETVDAAPSSTEPATPGNEQAGTTSEQAPAADSTPTPA